MINPSKSAKALAERIKTAIHDGQITNQEYEEILAIAEADHVIDPEERSLLTQLQELLANRTVIRIP